MQRVGNAWTLSYSTDGTTFTSCGTFTQALTVNQVGLHADNQASDPTAFKSVSFDYFHVATADAPTAVATYVYDVNATLPNVLTDGTRKYVYGLGLAYAVDGQGNVQVDHTDGNGNVVQVYQTDPFGVPTQTEGSASQSFQFTGQQRDGTDLVYLRARMYDPTIGRFLSRDPLAGVASMPQSLNRFAYALNNPVSERDPSGLKSQAAMPGECLFKTFLGPFILSTVFCTSPFAAPGKKEKQSPTSCPERAGLFYGPRKVGGYKVTAEGPEGGPNNCHVNLRADPLVNWHVYYESGEFVAKIGEVIPDWLLGPDELAAATSLVYTLGARLGDPTASHLVGLVGLLEGALAQLRTYVASP